MRFVDNNKVIIADDWVDTAKKNKIKPLWSYLRQQLEDIVGKKCWYSETTNIGSDNPIDHFRPKTSKVRKLTKSNVKLDDIIWQQINSDSRIGYTFLELEFKNYRYCCDYVNGPHKRNNPSGLAQGKWDFFPLKKDSKFAVSAEDINDDLEQIALLDPCNQKDPEMLTFNNLGMIEPASSILDTSWDYCRVKVTIEVYHLKYYLLIDYRKELWEECERLIALASSIYKKPNKTEQETHALAFYIADLIKKTRKKSAFSAVAVDCIREHLKHVNYKWLSEYLTEDMLKK